MKAPSVISGPRTVRCEFRTMAGAWAFAALLPVPVLVATNPADSAMIGCVYLGILNAWLVTEFHRRCGLPESRLAWRTRALAVSLALALNVGLFIACGALADVQTHFPFPLMAALSVVPAAGLVPWMLRRLPNQPYATVILAGFLVLACKLAGCVVARLVYGPDFSAQGYVAADWRTAKLMISLMWSLSTLLSLGLLLTDYRACVQRFAQAPYPPFPPEE